LLTHIGMHEAFPGATVLSLDDGPIREVAYQDTSHYQLTRDFLNAADRYFRHLLNDPEGGAPGTG
ncbi:MAG: AAA family ATPase, partial [Gemmatimonadota bacterium]|nr:AAA family ATPase [Gemmatimonadota bacterium]